MGSEEARYGAGSWGIRVQNQFLSVAPDKPGDFSVTFVLLLAFPSKRISRLASPLKADAVQPLLVTEQCWVLLRKKKNHTSFRHRLLPFLNRQFVDATFRPGSKLETIICLTTANYRTMCLL